ncbi:hypothetical protein OS493_022474 [Desmophyllum pertusum]|uniref:Integrase core domain-containing protein n=1 Tax=Desmophyllum pertusum TaxID=174260 RepID=A0A9W9ZMD3_9CNID|nr:hypothetical protein OS493_022474 [Desmophyllum pertusum]
MSSRPDELSRSIASAVSRAVERAVGQALSALPSQSGRGLGLENPGVHSVATAQELANTQGGSTSPDEDEMIREEFYQLESEGLLNPLNETDLFCLHYVYLPRINKSVSEFITAHNNHSVSTENNNTPAQMFWLNLQLTAFHRGFPEDAVWRGISVNELLTPDLPHVQVPETRSPLTEADTEALRSAIDPLSSTNGKELYIQTLRFVGIRLQQN